MNRRSVLQKASVIIASIAISKDTFASEPFLESKTLAEDVIKLSSNENPYGPTPLARKAMVEAVNDSNRYQWTLTQDFKKQIGELTGHTANHIIVGAGSSDLLGVICLLASEKKGNAVAPYPTFRLWMDAAENMGLKINSIPLTQTKDTDLKAMATAINGETRLVYICNPNNPTGVPIPDKELRQFIKNVPKSVWILLDEAYTEFEGTPSVTDMIDEFPNLIIAKTFSKIYGMAGARVGYAVAHADTVKKMVSLQPWANAAASYVSVCGAMAALKDRDFAEFYKKENTKCRNILYKALEKHKLAYVKSATNFVYFDSMNYGKDLAEHFKNHGILGARTFEKDTTWLRLSIGTETEMKRVAEVLDL